MRKFSNSKIPNGACRGIIILGMTIAVFAAYSGFLDNGMFIWTTSLHSEHVKKGTIIRFEIHLLNGSRFPTQVYILPECGCTRLNMSRVYIAPLKFAVIYADIDTSRIKAGATDRGVMIGFQNSDCSWTRRITTHFSLGV